MDSLSNVERNVVKAIGRVPLCEVDPIALAVDLGLPIEGVHEVLAVLADLSPDQRERLDIDLS